MLAGALLLLMPALAVLQFRWVGQVSSAEKERMQRNVEIAASQFREAFDGELGRSLRDLSVSSATAREVAWDRYATRYEEWKSSTSHSGLVSNVYLIDADNGRLGARRWDVAARTFVRVEWPSILASSREDFEAELAEFTTGSGVGNRPRPSMPVDSGHTLLITPLRGGPIFLPRASGTGRATGTVPRTLITVFGFTVIELDLPYIQNEVLPALAERHFNHSNVDTYRVTVVDQNDPTRVVFKTDRTRHHRSGCRGYDGTAVPIRVERCPYTGRPGARNTTCRRRPAQCGSGGGRSFQRRQQRRNPKPLAAAGAA